MIHLDLLRSRSKCLANRRKTMLIKFLRNEIALGKCLYGFMLIPRVCIKKADMFISWLGGCIVWSRLKRAHKDNKRV